MLVDLIKGGIGVDNSRVKDINYPILSGGFSTCNFEVRGTELNLGDEIEVKDGSTVLFEGTITQKSRVINIKQTGKLRNYKAVCKAYKLATEETIDEPSFEGTGESFQGNGVEFEEWKVREDSNLHVTWPPNGDVPIIFDDRQASVALPSNQIEITETEENQLPSAITISVAKYIEKRFPCKPAFDENLPTPTPELLTKNPLYHAYGRQYKIMDPADPTIEFNQKILENAKVGGVKFGILGGNIGDGYEYPETENLSLSASINPKKSNRTLTPVGSPIPPSGGGSGSISFPPITHANFAQVSMRFYFKYILPRVFGDHGPGAGKQETFVRARMLDKIERIVIPVGGIGREDNLGKFNHVEVEVKADLNDGVTFRDLTFGAGPGLLNEEHDKGGGIWTADLSGLYIEEEGIERANDILAKALEHYENIKFSSTATLAGINFDFNRKVDINGTDICLDSINWTFGLKASENRTKYSGTRLLFGFSPAQGVKKRFIASQEIRKDEEEAKSARPQHHDNIAMQNVKMHARIHWNITPTGNKSQGEIVVRENGVWTPVTPAQVVHISHDDSLGTNFKTGGDDTIFEIEKILSDIDVDAFVADLYRVVTCIQDGGANSKNITHMKVTQKTPKLIGELVTTDNNDNPWGDIETNGVAANSYIKTTIDGTAKINNLGGIIPKEWNLAGTGNFAYMRRVAQANLEFGWNAIKPVFINGTEWESAKKQNDGTTPIATYSKV